MAQRDQPVAVGRAAAGTVARPWPGGFAGGGPERAAAAGRGRRGWRWGTVRRHGAMLGAAVPDAAAALATTAVPRGVSEYRCGSMRRACARPACCGSATTTLSYDYANATVWIEPLHVERHPMHHDLCERHAARLSVPVAGRWSTAASRPPPPGLPWGDAEPGRDDLARRAADAWDPSGSIIRDRGRGGRHRARPGGRCRRRGRHRRRRVGAHAVRRLVRRRRPPLAGQPEGSGHPGATPSPAGHR